MLIVSNYHYIREDFDASHPSIFGKTPRQFKSQLEKLSQFGQFISQEELLDDSGKISNKNYFLITFDDGLKEQYELAKPILDEMGIPFIFFINTSNFSERKVSLVHKIHLIRSQIAPKELLGSLELDQLSKSEKQAALEHYNYDSYENALLKYILNFKFSIDKQERFVNSLFNKHFDENKIAKDLYFSDSMLKDLYDKDMLGSHSHTHLPLGRITLADAQKDLKNSQEFFLKNFGTKASSLSYPYGSLDSCEGVQDLVKNLGFSLGFTVERAANESLQKDSLLLARFDCNDLPGGKNDLFKNKNPFETARIRKWHTYENSTAYKR